ncbi:bifunctional UDP-N-acetylglucosamine diphosphorylase/glucosamine-1-phosphate N-acetyltransferase GlmU [Parasulfitobacter algicola]|uniref:Bifunctional protein GlmU n=1 Tax=Parasulfitobacter algicola TaxID=2614809 RepID=A0ABX2IND4_9RHOB|nr:bifunctional UDP-N-acetylglucosamine diphosphorylase/glucosamine-1-phosphate N-acetyltransferase GlmU [Sulfitobacter algicola]NSX54378.1 bifunctional UDP-N-acetylglucosamine diphosphorylase/glucosamine-1-phosphate N-acetyltransferase GlmU [Sulfitobacter algicola]
MSTALIILAAGQGTRMNSDLPKVLHQVAGAPLLVHAMKSGASVEPERTVIVAGHGADAVKAAAKNWDADVRVVMQDEQLGTGHAVLQAREALQGFQGDVIVLFGDTPFIAPNTLEQMIKTRRDHAVVVLGFQAADPGRYGRLIMVGDQLDRIVEYKDASDDQRAVTLCNSGVMAADATVLFDLLDAVKNDNAAGEYYLTDIPAIARSRDLTTTIVTCDEAETLGINTRAQLAEAEAAFQARARADAMDNGVTLQAPDTVIFAHDTVVGRDTMIEPNVVFGPDVTVESAATIRAFSHLEGCHVSRGAIVGPYARLRPGTELAEGVRVGNFVEVKNAELAAGAKVNHLSYIGDAEIGADTNVGAGTITCNYDGVMKHRTVIGERAFIGSNTMLVAPVDIGDEAMTGSGSVITEDVAAGDLALGRSRQVNKTGLARRMMNRLRAIKAKGLN